MVESCCKFIFPIWFVLMIQLSSHMLENTMGCISRITRIIPFILMCRRYYPIHEIILKIMLSRVSDLMISTVVFMARRPTGFERLSSGPSILGCDVHAMFLSTLCHFRSISLARELERRQPSGVKVREYEGAVVVTASIFNHSFHCGVSASACKASKPWIAERPSLQQEDEHSRYWPVRITAPSGPWS